MKENRKGNLELGSNVVELLLPHRRPFLMVDFVRAFRPGATPSIEAGRQISMNEEIFAGHFPGLHVWPGAFTIEGLGQTAVLLIMLLHLRERAQARGQDPETALDPLLNLDLGYRLQPGYNPKNDGVWIEDLLVARSQIAVGTSVQMKFQRPVFAGQRLDYRVVMTGRHAGGMRFDSEASVDGSVVASGTMMGATVTRPILPGQENGT